MRTTFLTALLGLFVLTFSSCSSSQSFFVNGYPGTVIAMPEGNVLAQIDRTGTTQITMKRSNGYYNYLLAQSPNSDLPVPFALDYKDHNRNGAKYALEGFGGTVGIAGGIAAFGGLVGAIIKTISEGDDANTKFLGGLGLAGIGAGLVGGGIYLCGSNMDQQERNYDYLPQQTTNNDIIQ